MPFQHSGFPLAQRSWITPKLERQLRNLGEQLRSVLPVKQLAIFNAFFQRARPLHIRTNGPMTRLPKLQVEHVNL